MKREELFKKYYKNPEHDYEISETLSYVDDTGRLPDICFVYSGRNRAKSFEVASQLIADAWYDNKLFGYIRRYEANMYEIELYFADKHKFIKDMTDGKFEGITKNKGELVFYHDEAQENGSIKRIYGKSCGYFFALSKKGGATKSLQFPDVYNLLYEEVLTDDAYLQAEPEKLMNLYSTVRRSKSGFRMWLISNTVSVVNPYSKSWGIYLTRVKAGEVHLSKLYLNSLGEDGHEQYLLIAAHYLKDKNVLTKEDYKKKRNRIKTSIASNKWDELHLYTTIDLSIARKYGNVLDTVIFEYDDIMLQANILEIPANLLDVIISDEYTDIDDIGLYTSDVTMPVLYIFRKTTEPKPNTRLYTNNAMRFSTYTTRGFKQIYKIDSAVDKLIKRGWIMGADNLTMNDFRVVLRNLTIMI